MCVCDIVGPEYMILNCGFVVSGVQLARESGN